MAGRFERLKAGVPELAGFAALALVALLQFLDFDQFSDWRMQVFDNYQQLSPRGDADDSLVAVVDITEDSILELGQWPWPRTDLAELTRRLGEAGARVVVYDIAFSEPDRTSPAQIAQSYAARGRGDVIGDSLAGLPDHDAEFAASFASVPVVTGYFLDPAERGRDIEPKASFTLSGTMPDRHVPSYPGTIPPLPQLEEAAAGNGFVTRSNDGDEIARRVPLVAIQNGMLVPSLSLEAVRVAQDAGNPNLRTSDGSGENLGAGGAAVAVRLGDTEIPVTSSGEMWVHFPNEATRPMIPAASIITGTMSDAELAGRVAGRIVLVGSSANGLSDLVATPLRDRNAGVIVHAGAVEQMLTGHFLERPDWALGLELVLVLVLGGVLAFLLPRLGAVRGALLALLGMGLVIAVSWLAFTRLNYLLDPTYPLAAIAIVYVLQTVVVFLREERQRRYIHSAFDRYLSPEMVRQIADNPGKLELGGEERDMSVMMCDVRGFSRISEQYTPKQVIEFLITFLTPMSDILMARKATLDKYIGDAILAFWNAPLDDPDHHRNAARAALDMVTRTQQLNREMPGREGVVWPGEVKIGIGLNSGLCCVGNMGSEQRLNYSLIGDTVNVAARLEGQTKAYGVPIIAGSALASQLAGFAVLEIDRVRVVGRDAPETIFALIGDEDVASGKLFETLEAAHMAMIDAYRAQDWDRAEAALAEEHDDYSAMGIAGLHDLFVTRIAALRADPPGEGWDGTYQATQK